MARTNAFICDRCGKTAKQNSRYQIRTRWRLSWASDWNRVIDLCSSCYKEFEVFMDMSAPTVTKATCSGKHRLRDNDNKEK